MSAKRLHDWPGYPLADAAPSVVEETKDDDFSMEPLPVSRLSMWLKRNWRIRRALKQSRNSLTESSVLIE